MSVCFVLTFGFQVDVLIRTQPVHELPHDDGEAEDVTFGRPADRETDLSQELRSRPVHLYDAARETQTVTTKQLRPPHVCHSCASTDRHN